MPDTYQPVVYRDPPDTYQPVVYLTAAQVRRRYGGDNPVSNSWLDRRIRDHGFPHPRKFGGAKSDRFWLLTEIEEWERTRATEVQQ